MMIWAISKLTVYSSNRKLQTVNKKVNRLFNFLDGLKNKWNELEVHRPHITDAAMLMKRAEEDKFFQLLSSLDSTYEDLHSHILMNSELPSFTSVCASIQREEVHRKVMKIETKTNISETRAYLSNHKHTEEKVYKGKRPYLKCSYCNNIGHVKERCWILHPKLKLLKFIKDNKGTHKKF